ncbi:MAG TPA: MFS transporter [Noviherbaspirillum sp.]|uniref:MFS transporter n=1 Tax=Noviherbaspirillum sp. TaxID=1926288 RepID=UPI002B4A682A|nr:MFS transporter [Noviherbaspirillum sp.]HJV87320.1 MFS transporter [Noviherbaspirillum sp.]
MTAIPTIRVTLAIRVFLSFASGYFLSYAFRSVNAVIAPVLLDEIGLTNADLGLLSSAYFISFACMQLPLGIWLDKYGSRRTESALLLFAAVGAALFASSDSLPGLWLGRALIGVGVSACLMAPIKAYRQWFAPERQSQLASWMLVAGTSGALAATVPVNAALPLIGWRGVFWIMSAMILASAAAIFFLLKKMEAAHPQPASHAASSSGGYKQVFGNPFFRRMSLLGTVNHGSFVALQTLWAGPWMITVLGLDKAQTARVLFMFNLSLLLAYLVMSWWAPRHVLSQHGSNTARGVPVMRVIAVGLTGAILAQAGMLATSASWSWIFWIMMAICITVATLVQTEVSLSFPIALTGRANTAYNLLLFVGAFVVQWGVGLLIDLFKAHGASAANAMRMAFALCLACQVISLAIFLMNRTRPVAV